MRVAIQPCGDSVAQAHYIDTIKHLVPSERVRPFLDAQQLAAFDRACGDATAVWGVTPGKTGQNKKKWSKLRVGDIALLYRNKKIFSQGRIVLCIHNEALAVDLWSRTADGVTWEYLYFMDDLQEVDVSVDQYNAALDYAANNIVQGFQVHEDEQAEALLDMLGEYDNRGNDLGLPNAPTTDDLKRRLAELQATDLPGVTKLRQESGIFRKHLFGAALTGHCALCHRLLPVGFLVAAHIKKRASCSEQERRDLAVVMPACKLGCDELYERSYIAIFDDGVIQGMPALEGATAELRSFASSIVGKHCTAHCDESSTYFTWHRDHPRRYLRQR